MPESELSRKAVAADYQIVKNAASRLGTLSADGRPMVLFEQFPDTSSPSWKDLDYWVPSPVKNGDPVYSQGVRIGTFRGDLNGKWYILTFPLSELPSTVAENLKAMEGTWLP
jgi:hypothetical protein